MTPRGFVPAGGIVEVPLSGGGSLFVQEGSCGDGCEMLFIFLNGEFLGTDWPEASSGILGVAPAGADRFNVTYANGGQAPVTVTFTWSGGRLRPNATAPGQCRSGC